MISTWSVAIAGLYTNAYIVSNLSSVNKLHRIVPVALAAEVEVNREDERCQYCGVRWYPSIFHPGSCGECGAPR